MLTLLAHDGVGEFTHKDAVHEVHLYTFLPVCLWRRERVFKSNNFSFLGFKSLLDIKILNALNWGI